MTNPVLIGVIAALFAAIAWSFSFIVPSVIGAYSIFDYALLEFVLSGLLSGGLLLFKLELLRGLGARDWLVAGWLGCIGFLGYFLALTGATINAGPVIAPAFLGSVPVVLAIAGNLRQHTVRWKSLIVPLTLAFVGLLLVNGSNWGASGTVRARSLPIGIALALLAVFLWTWFGLLNQSALARRPRMDDGVWTGIMMVGAGAGMLAFLPFGLMAGVFAIPRLGLHWDVAAPLYRWTVGLALTQNIGAAWAWTVASRRLPVALAAQLITMEPTFGTIFGLIVRRQWPTPAEGVGMALLLIGVAISIRVFHAPAYRRAVMMPDTGAPPATGG